MAATVQALTDYLTLAEIAANLRVSKSTVSRWSKDGSFPRPVAIRSTRRYPRLEVEAFLRERQEETQAS